MDNKWIRNIGTKKAFREAQRRIGRAVIDYYDGFKVGDFSNAGILTNVYLIRKAASLTLEFEIDGKRISGWWIWIMDVPINKIPQHLKDKDVRLK